MTPQFQDLPVACCLSDAEFRNREATLLADFKSAVIATEELPDGYSFLISGEKRYLALLSEVMAAERQCCPFLTFELTAQPKMGPLSLRVTGPAGTKDFLKDTFCPSASAL